MVIVVLVVGSSGRTRIRRRSKGNSNSSSGINNFINIGISSDRSSRSRSDIIKY